MPQNCTCSLSRNDCNLKYHNNNQTLKDIEEKIVDTDHREILGLVSNVHALELQLVAQREEVQCLSTVVEEQGHYINSQQQYNVQLLEVVRTQQELLTANNIPNTPRLDTLYQLVGPLFRLVS